MNFEFYRIAYFPSSLRYVASHNYRPRKNKCLERIVYLD